MPVTVGFIEDPELNYRAVVFGDEASGETLELQRSLVIDEQDRLNGMDDYCLVLASGPTFYGGIEAWRVGELDVAFRLSPEAADVLGLGQEVVLEIHRDAIADLGLWLAKVVDDVR